MYTCSKCRTWAGGTYEIRDGRGILVRYACKECYELEVARLLAEITRQPKETNR